MDFIDRVLNLAGDTDANDNRSKLEAIRSLVILHTAIQSWHWVAVQSGGPIGPKTLLALMLCAAVLTIGFGVSLVPRFAQYASWLCIPVLLFQANLFFPSGSNHMYLSIWCVALLAIIGDSDDSDTRLGVQALQWSVAIVLFASGLQKVLFGTYFQGDFIAYAIAVQESFGNVFQVVVPSEEIVRLQGLDLRAEGAGPVRVDSLLFMTVTNLVWIAEMALPVALIHRRFRTLAAAASIGMVLILQLGAREMLFGMLMLILLLLFPPAHILKRAFWPLVFVYVYLLGMSVGWLPGGELLRSALVPGRLHL